MDESSHAVIQEADIVARTYECALSDINELNRLYCLPHLLFVSGSPLLGGFSRKKEKKTTDTPL